MIYWELLCGFLKVGCFAFGGAYGAIPIIREVVLANGWLTDDAISYMIAVSESTPGPIMINLATYVGSSQAGFFGSLLATSAVVLPSFIVILAAAMAMEKMLRSRLIQAVLGGLKPCVTGIILATGVFMVLSNVFSLSAGLHADVTSLFLTLGLALVYYGVPRFFRKKISPVMLILISAVCGVILYRG